MPAYRTIVVGTDGSSTPLAAVDRAASVVTGGAAEPVIVRAYPPASREQTRAAQDGWTPIEETLRAADERPSAVDGAPVDVLRAAVDEHDADLPAVGNRGLSTRSGRLLGSAPSDVPIVHTT